MKGKKPNRYMRGGFRLCHDGTPVVNTRLTRAGFLRGAAVAGAGVAAAGLGMGGVAYAAPGDTYIEVSPTGDPNQDVPNIQQAFDDVAPGGTVKLMAGEFHLGDESTPYSGSLNGRGRIVFKKHMTVIGDGRDANGDPKTVIKGGGETIEMTIPSPVPGIPDRQVWSDIVFDLLSEFIDFSSPTAKPKFGAPWGPIIMRDLWLKEGKGCEIYVVVGKGLEFNGLKITDVVTGESGLYYAMGMPMPAPMRGSIWVQGWPGTLNWFTLMPTGEPFPVTDYIKITDCEFHPSDLDESHPPMPVTDLMDDVPIIIWFADADIEISGCDFQGLSSGIEIIYTSLDETTFPLEPKPNSDKSIIIKNNTLLSRMNIDGTFEGVIGVWGIGCPIDISNNTVEIPPGSVPVWGFPPPLYYGAGNPCIHVGSLIEPAGTISNNHLVCTPNTVGIQLGETFYVPGNPMMGLSGINGVPTNGMFNGGTIMNNKIEGNGHRAVDTHSVVLPPVPPFIDWPIPPNSTHGVVIAGNNVSNFVPTPPTNFPGGPAATYYFGPDTHDNTVRGNTGTAIDDGTNNYLTGATPMSGAGGVGKKFRW